MCSKEKHRKKDTNNMERAEKTKINYLLCFLMIAVVIQLSILIYRLVILTSV